jgi:formylglycine-generating enzyme required for sulfatase activity
LLADHYPLRLVLLNACEGARGSDRDIFSSTAAILVQRGLPAVLAMQYEITDRAAIEFSRTFYEAIADRYPVDAAVAEARIAVNIGITNTLEWGTPVLYMRSPDGVLFGISQETEERREAGEEDQRRMIEAEEARQAEEARRKTAEEEQRRVEDEARWNVPCLNCKGTGIIIEGPFRGERCPSCEGKKIRGAEEAKWKAREEERKGAKEFTNSLGMKFVLIPAGTFMMGSPPDEIGRNVDFYDDNKDLHNVTISKPFFLQTTQVTQGQWKKAMGNNPSYFKSCGDNCRVENVSWVDAQEFIRKLNRVEGADKYRLPTEAEWEYACRAGSTTRYYFGDDYHFADDEAELGEYAWYANNSDKKTHPVGQKEPNAWGLYDMHGNVWEWCQDYYGRYTTWSVTDPKKTAGNYLVARGGSWNGFPRQMRSAYRAWNRTGDRGINVSFRLARDT